MPDPGPMSGTNSSIPRPPNVKRDTSHKLETIDVEPTMKKMNRQTSIGHRTGSMSSVEEITEKDIKHLNSSLEQSSIIGDEHRGTPKKPHTLKETDRLTTIDRFIVDIEGKSSPLDGGSKNDEVSININEVIMRPSPLTDNDRFSTLGTIDSDLFGGLTNAAPV